MADTGALEGPRILATNQVICMPGGHGHWLGRETDGPDDVRKAVRSPSSKAAGRR